MSVFRLCSAFPETPSPDLAKGPLGALDRALTGLKGGGRFAMGARIASLTPTLEIAGFGTLSLPVPPEQARALISLAEQAPYGRGDATLVDPNVRRSWQIAPERVRFVDPIWERKTLPRVLQRVKKELGVAAEIEANLYKLLIYEEGGFFLEHRDTEKAPAMFGTLVIALPSAHRGGELIVRHEGQTATIGLRSTSLSRTAFAAFYTDCLHSLAPVTAGHRVCLVYNLVSTSRLAAPRPTGSAGPAINRALLALAALGSPAKVVRVLSHHYTPAGLAFDKLKGDDAAVASALLTAARETGYRLFLGMVSICESGAAEEAYRPRGRWRSHVPDDTQGYDVIEVYESEVEVTGLRTPTGDEGPLTNLPLEPDEVIPVGLLEREPFDEDHFSEATGNEGGSFERIYRRAALVLWPAARDIDMLAQLPMAERVMALIAPVIGGQHEAHAMLERLVATWWDEGGADASTRSTLLGLLVKAERVDLVERFLVEVHLRPPVPSAHSRWHHGPNLEADDLEGLALVSRSLPPDSKLMDRVLARYLSEPPSLGVAAKLVAMLCALGGPRSLATARTVCETIAQLTRTDPRVAIPSTLLATLIPALESVDAEHGTETATTLVKTALGRPQVFDLDQHLIASARALGPGSSPARRMLEAAVIDGLEARTRTEPQHPTTWAREAPTGCGCEHCKRMVEFMCSPERESFDFKANERDRRHVEGLLYGHDVQGTTLRGSSPLTLRLTKNSRSFEKQLDRYLADLAALSQFTGE